jgi:hypothetical protein
VAYDLWQASKKHRPKIERIEIEEDAHAVA